MKIDVIFTESFLSDTREDYIIIDTDIRKKMKKNCFTLNFALTSWTFEGETLSNEFIGHIVFRISNLLKGGRFLNKFLIIIPLTSKQSPYFKENINLDLFSKRLVNQAETKFDIYEVSTIFFDIKAGSLAGRTSSIIFHKINTEREYTNVFAEVSFKPLADAKNLASYLF